MHKLIFQAFNDSQLFKNTFWFILFSIGSYQLSLDTVEAQSPAATSQTKDIPISGLPLPDKGAMLSDLTGVKKDQWSLSLAVPWGGEAHQGFEDSV